MHSVTETKITPDMFFNEEPPERIIGVEDEYDIQIAAQPSGSSAQAGDYISQQAIKNAGLRVLGNYTENGAKLYQDMGHAEYCTPECLGPYQAAAADIAGMHVIASVVEASGLKHNGLYRISGTWDNAEYGTTNGVHENFMAPASISHNSLLVNLLPTYYATRLGTMAGTISRNKYIFSQKEHGIGDAPIERHLIRRVSHGSKPMALILKEESETVGNGWLRLETRYADAPISLAARRHALATTSLMLRLVEHENLFNESEFDDIILKDPVSATHVFMRDMSLRKKAEVRSGKRLNMLDIEEKLAEKVLFLCERIKLPEDEIDAANIWPIINAAFRRSNPAKADYDPYLLREYGVATKHYWLKRIGAFDKGDAESKTRSLQWDRVLPTGNGIAMMKNSKTVDPEVETLQTTAPLTRAAIRQQFIQEFENNPKARVTDWNGGILPPRSIPIDFSDPYGYRD
ncbi:MAG: proteasome accessory factor PafA2 family protein [Candidatus Nomurabacteria bacterium]|nr:MAG: proteasome accessory factor PafA2 family protein [Candidatus Nomurabacteria bacterium]